MPAVFPVNLKYILMIRLNIFKGHNWIWSSAWLTCMFLLPSLLYLSRIRMSGYQIVKETHVSAIQRNKSIVMDKHSLPVTNSAFYYVINFELIGWLQSGSAVTKNHPLPPPKEKITPFFFVSSRRIKLISRLLTWSTLRSAI